MQNEKNQKEIDEKNRMTQRKKTSVLKRSVRIAGTKFEKLGKNLDFILIVFAAFLLIVTGYFFCRFKLGMSSSEIKSALDEFLWFLGSALSAIVAFVISFFVKIGTWRNAWSGIADKEKTDYDPETGLSLPAKNPEDD